VLTFLCQGHLRVSGDTYGPRLTKSYANARTKCIDLECCIFVLQPTLQTVLQWQPVMLKQSFQNIEK
jgi:hypothetical protein